MMLFPINVLDHGIIEAVEANDIETIQHHITDGSNEMQAVACYAAEIAKIETFHFAMSRGAYIDESLILCALESSRPLDVFTVLLNPPYNLDVNYHLETGGTPLVTAAVYNRKDLVVLLLSRGADPNKGNWGRGKRMPALQACAPVSNLEIMALLVEAGARVTGNGQIQDAARMGLSDAVQFYLDHGADANELLTEAALQKDYPRSPLAEATKAGKVRTAEILLDAGARIDVVDIYGTTVLQLAQNDPESGILEMFTRRGLV